MNFIIRTRLAASLCIAPLSVALGAPLTDFIVDQNQGPGTDFLTIQEAIFAAEDGDRLFVRAGNYGAFVVRKGLQIQALGQVTVNGPAQVLAIPADETWVLAGMQLSDLTIRTPSTVAVLDCEVGETIDVLQSRDVRFHRVLSLSPEESPLFRDSTFELVECVFRGRRGVDNTCDPEAGQAGLRVGPQAFGRASRSRFLGGRGGNAIQVSCFSSCAGPLAPGGAGVDVVDGGILLAGVPTDAVLGGQSGVGALCFTPYQWSGVRAEGGFVRYSGVDINAVFTNGTTVVTPPSPDVALRLNGDAIPGGTVELEITGTAGAFAELFIGRGVLPLVIDPLVGTEPSITPGRRVMLPTIPASGTLRVPLTIPPSYSQGTLLWLQARSEDSQGPAGVMFSNSLPLLIR